jgi:hypothetical protein
MTAMEAASAPPPPPEPSVFDQTTNPDTTHADTTFAGGSNASKATTTAKIVRKVGKRKPTAKEKRERGASPRLAFYIYH